MYKRIVLIATLLTFVVIVFGAYVRLTDAGLGCPDWPGCYGHLDVPNTPDEHAVALSKFPGKPVHEGKAWREMIHRYLASFLGLLILGIATMAWRRREALREFPVLPFLLVGLVIFQGILGKWTVTLLLKPAIVTSHLIGGLTILSLLVWLLMREFGPGRLSTTPEVLSLRPLAACGVLILACQIILGGWVSTNYAALACADLPLCRGELIPPMDLSNAFHVFRELGMTAEGGLLSNEALIAIHWVHRVGAIVTFLYIGLLLIKIFRVNELRRHAAILGLLLVGQVSLGLLNVLLSLPLAIAVAHNAVAALLLVSLVMLNYRLHAKRILA